MCGISRSVTLLLKILVSLFRSISKEGNAALTAVLLFLPTKQFYENCKIVKMLKFLSFTILSSTMHKHFEKVTLPTISSLRRIIPS